MLTPRSLAYWWLTLASGDVAGAGFSAIGGPQTFNAQARI
jgi:hypothetical protein